jgi:hypothetical protein
MLSQVRGCCLGRSPLLQPQVRNPPMDWHAFDAVVVGRLSLVSAGFVAPVPLAGTYVKSCTLPASRPTCGAVASVASHKHLPGQAAANRPQLHVMMQMMQACILTCSWHPRCSCSAAATGPSSPCLDAAPMRAMMAVRPTTTAVSSMKQQSAE